MSPILPTLKTFVTVFALDSQLFLSFCSFRSLWFTDEGKKIHLMLSEKKYFPSPFPLEMKKYVKAQSLAAVIY